MIQRLVAELARVAVERRGLVLLVYLLLVAAFASQLPKLKVDTSPEALVSEIEGQKDAEALFQKAFGRSETQIITLVQAEDVLSKDALEFQYRAHEALSKLPIVSRVDDLTHAHLPSQFSDPSVPENLPPEALLARRSEIEKRVAQARAEGKFPSVDTLQAIVDGEEEAYPQGVETLTSRLLSSESPEKMSLDWDAKTYERYVRFLKKADWLKPLLLSRDHSAAAIIVHLDRERVFDETTRMDALDQVRKTIADIERPADIHVDYGGSPVLGEAILRKLDQDRLTLNPAMAVLCLLVLVVTFRWWPAVVAPLLAVALACLGVMGAMAFLDQPLTILTNIIPPLLLIVGLSDSVHLLGRYREEVQKSPDRLESAKSATRSMIVACFLTSLTTAVGFGSMAWAKTEELKRFGFAASFGVMLAYFATVFCVPAFVSFFKPPASWSKHPSGKERVSRLERIIASIALLTMRHFKWVAGLALVSTIGLSYLASKVEADARLLDAFDDDEPIAVVTHTLEKKLAGIRPLEVLLSAEDESLLSPQVTSEIASAEAWLSADPQVISVSSYLDPLRALRSSLSLDTIDVDEPFSSKEELRALSSVLSSMREDGSASYLSDDEKIGRMTVFFEDSGVRHTMSVINKLEKQLNDHLGAQTHIRLTLLGEAYTGSMGRQHVLRDLLSGLGMALVTIFGLLTLLFRSLPLGLVAMPPNVIPLLATGAYMMARGIQLNLATVITFSIGIGLAVDDTVHVVARFREESAKVTSTRVALLRSVRGTGTAIVVTAISLALGFGVLMMSEFVSVRQFGELISITVVNCLLGALLIQPALLRMVMGRSRTLSRKRKPKVL